MWTSLFGNEQTNSHRSIEATIFLSPDFYTSYFHVDSSGIFVSHSVDWRGARCRWRHALASLTTLTWLSASHISPNIRKPRNHYCTRLEHGLRGQYWLAIESQYAAHRVVPNNYDTEAETLTASRALHALQHVAIGAAWPTACHEFATSAAPDQRA
jgi:hypothetical protein